MYSRILDPITLKSVDVTSFYGKNIIKLYIRNLISGGKKNKKKKNKEKDREVPKEDTEDPDRLIKACEAGNLREVSMLLDQPDIDDNQRTSGIYMAVFNGKTEVVRLLVEKGVDVNSAINGTGGSTPMFIAAQQGQNETIKLLHSLGGSVTHIDNQGDTPMHIAAQNGHNDTIRLLHSLGGSVTLSNNYGHTPLWLAVFKLYYETINLIAKLGGNVNQENNNGVTPMFVAAEKGRNDIITLLNSFGGDVNKSNNNGATPMFVAAQNGHYETIKLLNSLGGNVNQSNKNGTTPLFMATNDGHTEVVRFLIEEGNAEVDKAMTNDGTTPLHIAAHRGNINIVKLLLDNGANIDAAKLDNGWTPLIIACFERKSAVVAELMRRNANYTAKTTVDYAGIKRGSTVENVLEVIERTHPLETMVVSKVFKRELLRRETTSSVSAAEPTATDDVPGALPSTPSTASLDEELLSPPVKEVRVKISIPEEILAKPEIKKYSEHNNKYGKVVKIYGDDHKNKGYYKVQLEDTNEKFAILPKCLVFMDS